MKRFPAEFADIGAPGLLTDYIRQKQITNFFDVQIPISPRSFEQKAKAVRNSGGLPREHLSELLMQYNADFQPSAESINAILSLKDENTFTITSGQQLSLFGGPVFTIYKIITAIGLARYLSSATSFNVVPVFWLADEDHDFDEIRSFRFPSADLQINTAKVHAEASQKNFAAGKLRLNGSIEQAIEQLYKQAGPLRISKLSKDLLSHWKPGSSWREAFAKGIMHIFGDYGIILAGSDNEAIKQATSPVWETLLKHQPEITSALEDQSLKLMELDYTPQVTINKSDLFWHHPENGRLKVPFEENNWQFPPDSQLTTEEAASFVENNQLYGKLSPNVFMRPVLQQYMLPNIGYAGGPSEVAYHAQMKQVFRQFNVEMPVILPRLSATLIEPSVNRICKSMPFGYTSYKQAEHELVSQYLNSSSALDSDAFFEDWRQESRALMEKRLSQLSAVDETLETSAGSTQQRIEHELSSLKEKLRKQLKEKESIQIKRLKRIQHHLFPGQSLQEREYGWLYYTNMYGTNWIRELLSEFERKPFMMLQKHHYIEL